MKESIENMVQMLILYKTLKLKKIVIEDTHYFTVVFFHYLFTFCGIKNVKSILSPIVPFIIYFQLVPLKLKDKDM